MVLLLSFRYLNFLPCWIITKRTWDRYWPMHFSPILSECLRNSVRQTSCILIFSHILIEKLRKATNKSSFCLTNSQIVAKSTAREIRRRDEFLHASHNQLHGYCSSFTLWNFSTYTIYMFPCIIKINSVVSPNSFINRSNVSITTTK